MVVKKTAYIFPGQGAQFVGMGKDVYDNCPGSREVFEKANNISGYDLAKLCFEGPEEELTRTKNSQPAIFVTSLAVLACLREKLPKIRPAASLGLSLGEYTALVAIGSLSFEDGLRLVQIRGEAMEDAGAKIKGTMASVLGMEFEACKEVCDSIEGVQIANLNSPGQIVISGTPEGVAAASIAAKEKGAKKIIPLKVSGAFHSDLMASAAERLKKAVDQTEIKEPDCLFLPNFTARPVKDVRQIKENLLSQLTGTVRWSDSFAYVIKQEILRSLEIGPGSVLKGLAKKIDNTAEVFSIETVEQIDSLKEEFVKT